MIYGIIMPLIKKGDIMTVNMKTFNNDVKQFNDALQNAKEEIRKGGGRVMLLRTENGKEIPLSVTKAQNLAVKFKSPEALRLINRHHTSMKGKLKGFTKFLNFIFHHRIGKSHTKDSVKAYKAINSKQAAQLMAMMHELKEGASDKEVITKVAESLKSSEKLDNSVFAAIAQLSSKYPKQYLNLINGIKDTQIVSEEVMSDLAAFTTKARASIKGYQQKVVEEPVQVTVTEDKPVDVKPPVDNKPVTGKNKPITDENNPVTDENNPVTDENKPVTDEKTSVTDEKTPVTDEKTLVTDEKKPENQENKEESTLFKTVMETLTNFISPAKNDTTPTTTSSSTVKTDVPPAEQVRVEEMKQLEAAIKELTDKYFIFAYQNAGANGKVNFDNAKKQLADVLVNFANKRLYSEETIALFGLLDQVQNAKDVGTMNDLLKQVQERLAKAPKTKQDLIQEHIAMLETFKTSTAAHQAATNESHRYTAKFEIIDNVPTFTMPNIDGKDVSLEGILNNAKGVVQETAQLTSRINNIKDINQNNQAIAGAHTAAEQARNLAVENFMFMQQIQNVFAVRQTAGKQDAQQKLQAAQEYLGEIQVKYGPKPKADTLGAARLAFAQDNVEYLTKLNAVYQCEEEWVNAKNALDQRDPNDANINPRLLNIDIRNAKINMEKAELELNQLNQKLIPFIKVQFPKAMGHIKIQNDAVKNQMITASKEQYQNFKGQANPLQGLKEALFEVEKSAKLAAELEQIAQEKIPTSVFELIPAKAKESPESLKLALDAIQGNFAKVTPFYWNRIISNKINLDSIFDRKQPALERGKLENAFIKAMLDPALESKDVQIENDKIVKIADKYFQ